MMFSYRLVRLIESHADALAGGSRRARYKPAPKSPISARSPLTN